MLLVLVKFSFVSLLDHLHHVGIQIQIIDLQLIILGKYVNLRWGLQWFEHCRDSFLTPARESCLRIIIQKINSTTVVQSVIHLHLDSSDHVSEFKERDQRSSLRCHRCKHLVFKLKTGFVARHFLKVFEKALLD